eukprot:scaffold897_cov402-Prasinococcus_capsulatus_cf.AAC.35
MGNPRARERCEPGQRSHHIQRWDPVPRWRRAGRNLTPLASGAQNGCPTSKPPSRRGGHFALSGRSQLRRAIATRGGS